MCSAATETDTYVHTLSLPDALPNGLGRGALYGHRGRHDLASGRDRHRPRCVAGSRTQAAGGGRRIPEPARPAPYRRSLRSAAGARSEEHTSELQSLMRISYAVFCLKKKKNKEGATHDTLS